MCVVLGQDLAGGRVDKVGRRGERLLLGAAVGVAGVGAFAQVGEVLTI
ncbi:hypothetical protein ABTX99_28790 [Streptomyces flaveolus]